MDKNEMENLIKSQNKVQMRIECGISENSGRCRNAKM